MYIHTHTCALCENSVRTQSHVCVCVYVACGMGMFVCAYVCVCLHVSWASLREQMYSGWVCGRYKCKCVVHVHVLI